MKKSPLPEILLVVLGIIALLLAWDSWRYRSAIRQLGQLQPRVAQYNGSRKVILESFYGELLEYSKKNAAIDPILQTIGLKPGGGSPAASSKNVNAITR